VLININKKDSNDIENMFSNLSNKAPNVGGILVSMMMITDFENILDKGDIEYNYTASCAIVNRHTCSPWTYMRKDLPPMTFIYPGPESPSVGIILDPNKVWDLITVMAVIDADTNNRSCCTNETGNPILTKNPNVPSDPTSKCIDISLKDKYGNKYDNYAVYWPSTDKGGSCPTVCKDDDTYCKYNNTGGNINTWIMNSSQECLNGNYKKCYDFKEIDEQNVPQSIKDNFTDPNNQPDGYLTQHISSSCNVCSKPYLCVSSNPPDNKNIVHNEPKRLASYIGPQGELWSKIAIKDDNYDSRSINGLQCRFEKSDWAVWIKVLRNYYSSILKFMKPNGDIIKKYSYEMANPYVATYLENEVNMYVDPDNTSELYKKQNKMFQDAIIGFFYVNSTCEDQLKPLDGIKTTVEDIENSTFTNNVDRCDQFFQNDPSNPNWNPIDGDTRRKYEQGVIDKSKDLAIKVANMFNKKYNKNVPVFSATPDSNSFYNYKQWTKALHNQIKFDDIFKKIN
jgi:hypothetical protein